MLVAADGSVSNLSLSRKSHVADSLSAHKARQHTVAGGGQLPRDTTRAARVRVAEQMTVGPQIKVPSLNGIGNFWRNVRRAFDDLPNY